MSEITMKIYGTIDDKKEQINEIKVTKQQEIVRFKIEEVTKYQNIECCWSQTGSSIVDEIDFEPEDTKVLVKGNVQHDDYIWIFDKKEAKLVFTPETNESELTISFIIRLYDYQNDPLFIGAIANVCESMSPMRDKYKERFEHAEAAYEEVINSTFWKMTSVPQKIVDRIRTRNFDVPVNLNVPVALQRKTKNAKDVTSITPQRRKEEEAYVFDRDVKFSILVPLFNTPKAFLKEMIESVQAQTYKNWELCLADASTEDHPEVGEIVQSYCQKDSRVKYEKLKENRGISTNTNECAKMATGYFLSLLDHDDLIHPSALFDTMKAICEKDADFVYTDEVVFNGENLQDFLTLHYKSDYAIDTLLANNYICHFSSFKKSLFDEVGGFRDEYNGSQDHDLILRLTDIAQHVIHVPEILYFWRSHENSTAKDIGAKPYAIQAGRNAVHDFLESKGIHSVVTSAPAAKTIYHIKYEILGNPKVSIIIPNKDHFELIRNCVDSILCKTNYENYEIIIIDNQSTEFSTLHYYDEIKKYDRVKILSFDEPFNFSKMNNVAAESADGDFLLFLNNDTEVITPEWITELLMFAQRDDVGAVGAKLIFPNDTIQHAGIIVGADERYVAIHAHRNCSVQSGGYMGKLWYASNFMAVTAACMMVKKSSFQQVGGFDETNFAVAYNDVDLCLKFYEEGKLNVFTPFAELYHYESISRGSDKESKNVERFKKEDAALHAKWDYIISKGDPFYNKNLSKDGLYGVTWLEGK